VKRRGGRVATSTLADWYRRHGRHELPWRATRDRWLVLMSEVMLHQTQVARVQAAWPTMATRFPTPSAMVAAGPGSVIQAWGRLGYPRRARWLHDAAVVLERVGWPSDLQQLPGVGRYTARAVRAQADGVDVPAVEVNVRRVVERVTGTRASTTVAEEASLEVGRPLRGRDRLLALMDLGALVCRPRNPDCPSCPMRPRCRTRGPLPAEPTRRAGRFEGSFRQRRGLVMAALREGPTPVAALDAAALASLLADGLAIADGIRARLP
jgi:A/G-specific adenine glycosylase